MKYLVRCRVSGGVTGTRESVCKELGVPLVFATKADAQAYADSCLRFAKDRPWSKAKFEYWVDFDHTPTQEQVDSPLFDGAWDGVIDDE